MAAINAIKIISNPSVKAPKRGSLGAVRAMDSDYSPARRDGFLRLAACVLTEAIRDLYSADPVRSIDALAWLACDESAIVYLQGLGVNVYTNCDVLTAIVRAG